MARRGKSSVKPVWLVAAGLIIVLVFIIVRFVLSAGGDSYRTVAELNVADYLENSNSLRGNEYKIEGLIANSLAWSPTEGRLYAVDVENGRDTVPILITPQFSQINIQKGQKFLFIVVVDEKGLLRTKNLSKI